MSWKRYFSVYNFAILLASPVLAKKDSDTVSVDCANGDSINDALTNTALELTIEISGMCEENVYVNRPNVTLQGVSIPPYDWQNPPDPPSDPVDGIEAPDDFANALLVAGMNGLQFTITVENLILSGGNFGLGVNYGIVFVNNSRLVDNRLGGAVVAMGSRVQFFDTTLKGPSTGLWASGGANLARCTRCTIFQFDRRFGNAVTAENGAYVDLIDSEVRGRFALSASNARITVSGPDSLVESQPQPRPNPPFLPALGSAIIARHGGVVEVEDADLVGPVQLFSKSFASLDGVAQSVPGDTFQQGNLVSGDSTLELEETSVDAGLDMDGFSEGVFRAGAFIDGDLICIEGADAWCADPATVIGSTSDCSSCPHP